MEVEGRTFIISTPDELLLLITEAIRSIKTEKIDAKYDVGSLNKKLLTPKDIEKGGC